MASNDTGHGGGMAAGFTALVAILTVLGGLLLVTRQLSSERPLAKPGIALQGVGKQKVEARLWEDPFSPWEKTSTKNLEAWKEVGLKGLREQLQTRRKNLNDARTGKGTSGRILVMPVLVPGGAYSEMREARIRSRFAVVSALGQAGYVPEDPEHLGVIRGPWDKGVKKSDSSDSWISYEWYRTRTFDSRSGCRDRKKYILLIWVPEEPLIENPSDRLFGLIQPLIQEDVDISASVIGPMYSHTLRALTGGTYAPEHIAKPGSAAGKNMRSIFGRTSLYLATPNAMDEVLGEGTRGDYPRLSVRELLKQTYGFQDVRNLAATDDQLAQEVMDELKLRDLDLTDTRNHLVLVSEWDSFYGRMLSLTYAAELAVRQKRVGSRQAFIKARIAGSDSIWPTNLESFVYQRGLDGQTSSMEVSSKKTEVTRQNSGKPASLEDLKHWMPDGNRAEGPARFDYLSRLGNRIAELDRSLRREKGARVSAVGIVGGDTYDTLLILQALRRHFPDTLFFTTELDARLWNPSEWEWTRNLIVVSGYGLELNKEIQKQVPAFRSGIQTAQFAATLAALGEPKLAGDIKVPVRRFEIGRQGGVDLSVAEPGVLQPHPPWMAGVMPGRVRYLFPAVLGLVAVIILMTLMCRPWRALTVERDQHVGESLWLREEDIGSVGGCAIINRKLIQAGKQGGGSSGAIRWVWVKWQEFYQETDDPADRTRQRSMPVFLDFLNQMLKNHEWTEGSLIKDESVFDPTFRERLAPSRAEAARVQPFLRKSSLSTLQTQREVADRVLDSLQDMEGKVPKDLGSSFSSAFAASSARKAGVALYQARRAKARGFWWGTGALVVITLVLLGSCLRDTYGRAGGEPFSLISGTSAWPAVWLRFLSLVLAGIFIMRAYAGLKEGVLEVTRRYRLPLEREDVKCSMTLPTTPIPLSHVNAGELWRSYLTMGHWKHRLWRIAPLVLVYLLLGFALMAMAPDPLRPVRGTAVAFWERLSLVLAVLSFLILAFGTLDATRLCRWLIEQLSEAPTLYPASTREYFQRLRGGLEKIEVLNEWIDLKLISELTDRVGRLIYYPFIVFFVLLLSRNVWWDHWSWPLPLTVIFTLNLVFAVAAALILQKSAHKARRIGLERLQDKIKELRAKKPRTQVEKDEYTIDQLNELLAEMRDLKTGAFGTFWQSPVLGALLVPSGGTVALQVISYLMGR
jgi:hypothetical protein